MGDPAGIGPEITQKAWQKLRDDPTMAFFVIGDPALYENAAIIDHPQDARRVFKSALPVYPIDCPPAPPGKPNIKTAPAILKSIELATNFSLQNQAAGVVTNPIAKDLLYKAGFDFPGHTEYLAELTKSAPAPYERGPVMMLCAENIEPPLRVALASIHIPLGAVKAAVTKDLIINAARVIDGALKTDFGIPKPRIHMAGLNPHAGENGTLGRTELEILNPAAADLRAEGINISDAQSGDTLFHAEARAGYDAVLAMYHDQGLIPVKTLDFHGGVNTTLGLPIIRTSPDHGTAFDIAGKGKARPDSLIAALAAARKFSNNRTALHG